MHAVMESAFANIRERIYGSKEPVEFEYDAVRGGHHRAAVSGITKWKRLGSTAGFTECRGVQSSTL